MKEIAIALFVILASGCAFYFSTGFHAVWWLMWLAPIPVLVYAYSNNFSKVLLVSFVASLAFGLNSVIGYWATSIPSSAFLSAMILQSVKWTIVILVSRYLMRSTTSLMSIFAYPTCFALLEWIESFTIQGTFNTIANSQLQVLPVIQIASITGYLGITFILSLFSSSVAFAIIFWQEKKIAFLGLCLGLFVVILSLGYGYYKIDRLNQEKPLAQIKVGLISLSRAPKKVLSPESASEIFSAYLPLMTSSAAKGAEVILFPEESFAVSTETAPIYKRQLANFARQHHVKIIIGVKQHKKIGSYNSTWVFAEDGRWIGEYSKRHFVPKLEDGLTAGVDLLNFSIKENKSGVAICRDMDYLQPANDYGAVGTQILFVPAWDFDVDARVHAAGAWMRGVENGYTLVRAARGGFLSVSLPTGKIIAIESAISHQPTMLMADVPVYPNQSFYAQYQYWFVVLLWVLMMIIIIASL